jgi:hypothetical protein
MAIAGLALVTLRTMRRPAVGRVVVAGLGAVAGLIHLLLAREHFSEGLVLGLLFVMDGAALIGVSLWLAARPTARAREAAVLVLVLTAIAYLASRTIGLVGFGHETWDVVGVLTTAAEAIAAVALLAAPGSDRQSRWRATTNPAAASAANTR